MNSQFTNFLKTTESSNQKQCFRYFKFAKWDQKNKKMVKEIIQLKLNKNNYVIYSNDGEMLRCVQVNDVLLQKNLLNHIEQILHLQWIQENGQKISKLAATWRGEALINIGGYLEEGQKQGLWTNLFKKFQSRDQVNWVGQYIRNLQIGSWKYIYENKQIGGGLYNQYGQKVGKWMELSDLFNNNWQITYSGDYNKDGQKVGIWDINYKQIGVNGQCNHNLIGGGTYSMEGNKVGQWIELSDGFCENQQIKYLGKYNSNGEKIGRWDIIWNYNGQTKKIGGGSYDQLGGSKVGQWVELSEGYQDISQITYSGAYNSKGKKVGRWDIFFQKKQGDKTNEQIGGGSYHEQGDLKIGWWAILIKGFQENSQITYHGEYNINGKKIGKWDIWFRKNYGDQKNELIGGGTYNQNGGLKNGIWIELWEKFEKQNQIIYTGEYNLYGKKTDRWDIICDGKQIGGGSYNEKEGYKIGRWMELQENFDMQNQIILNGEYDNNGKKFGRWDILYHGKQIGGGSFDQKKISKVGRWVELWEDFSGSSQVTYLGEYDTDGKKIGRWDIAYEGIQIGGGSYSNQGSIKLGQWVELFKNFDRWHQIIFNGEYDVQGKKVGKWVEMKRKWNQKEFKKVSEVNYDD